MGIGSEYQRLLGMKRRHLIDEVMRVHLELEKWMAGPGAEMMKKIARMETVAAEVEAVAGQRDEAAKLLREAEVKVQEMEGAVRNAVEVAVVRERAACTELCMQVARELQPDATLADVAKRCATEINTRKGWLGA